MSTIPYQTQAFQWTRFFLTGDPASEKPTDATLQFLIQGLPLVILRAHPCIADGGQPSADLLTNEAELTSFSKALGWLMVSYFVNTPAGNAYAGNIVSTEVAVGEKGGVKRTRKEIDPATVSEYARAQMRASLLEIDCIYKASLLKAGQGSFMGTISQKRCGCRIGVACVCRPTEADLVRPCF